MLNCPKVGLTVQLHYATRYVQNGVVPHHGKVGTVVVRKTKGKHSSLSDKEETPSGGNLRRVD